MPHQAPPMVQLAGSVPSCPTESTPSPSRTPAPSTGTDSSQRAGSAASPVGGGATGARPTQYQRRTHIDPKASESGPRDFVAVGRVMGLVRLTRVAREFRCTVDEIERFCGVLGVPVVRVADEPYCSLLEFVRQCFAATTRPTRAFGDRNSPVGDYQWTESELDRRLWWYFNVMQATRRKSLLLALQDTPCFFGTSHAAPQVAVRAAVGATGGDGPCPPPKSTKRLGAVLVDPVPPEPSGTTEPHHD